MNFQLGFYMSKNRLGHRISKIRDQMVVQAEMRFVLLVKHHAIVIHHESNVKQDVQQIHRVFHTSGK